MLWLAQSLELAFLQEEEGALLFGKRGGESNHFQRGQKLQPMSGA
jgi:hypothetical protein